MRAEDDLSVLRSKYHDWCSARVADRFVELSPEEIYELASGATDSATDQQSRMASASGGAGAVSLSAGYSEMVRRVTEVLAKGMDLPTFEAWLESYRRDPARYEREMLGFWRDA
ncbi:MAG TPA: hypothetical protein VF039_01640 [Longimicrobiales bacterium]